jgi:hypothetical protein
MSLHILPQSVLAFTKALAPHARAHPNAKHGAAEPTTKNSAEAGHQTVPSQPFSCTSSGHAKASDVAAARRYYVDPD